MVQTTDFTCQSKTTAWLSSSHSLCPISAQILGLQAGGTSWYGVAREDEEGLLLRERLDGDPERESHDLLCTDRGLHPCPSQAWWGAGEPGGLKGSRPPKGTVGAGIW